MVKNNLSARSSAKPKIVRSGKEGASFAYKVDEIDWAYVREIFVQNFLDASNKRSLWSCTVVFVDDTWHLMQMPHRDEQSARTMAFRLSAEKDKPVGMYDAQRPSAYQKGDVA